jgi:hypothetical protein
MLLYSFTFYTIGAFVGYVSLSKYALISVTSCEIYFKKAKKYIDKMFEEKVGKSLKRELF